MWKTFTFKKKRIDWRIKGVKKTLKLCGLVLLIVLASLGIGIIGGIPIPTTRKKEDIFEIKTELVESKQEDKTALNLGDIKQ